MIRIFRLVISLILIPLCLAACQSDIAHRLASAESLMMQHPDSALAILKTIDHAAIRSDNNRALYGMLLTQALDKNHCDLGNDSLVAFAANHFRDNGDKERQMISVYYQGRVHYMADNYPIAIVLFLQAMEIAEELDRKFWVSMASRGVSDIYSQTYNTKDELAYAKKEYENMKAANIQPYLNYALLDLTRAELYSANYTEANQLAMQLLDSAKAYDDSNLLESALRFNALAHLGNDNPQRAIDYLNFLIEHGMGANEDSARLIVAYSLIGKTADAENILRKISCTDSILYTQSMYHAKRAEGNNLEALYAIETLDRLSSQILKTQMNQGLTQSVSNHYMLINDQNKQIIKASRIQFWLIIIISVLILGFISWLSFYLITRQKKRIEDKVVFAEQLQEQLIHSNAENVVAHKTIKDLLASKYELLEYLCDSVIKSNGSKYAKNRIAETVTSLISEFSINGAKISELGNQVDNSYNNLFTDFKNDLPNLKEADYCLFLFTVLGLSTVVISLFLKEEKVSSIYERKRRLKNKIKQLDEAKQKRYLQFLA